MAKKKKKLMSGYYDANVGKRITDANIEENESGWKISPIQTKTNIPKKTFYNTDGTINAPTELTKESISKRLLNKALQKDIKNNTFKNAITTNKKKEIETSTPVTKETLNNKQFYTKPVRKVGFLENAVKSTNNAFIETGKGIVDYSENLFDAGLQFGSSKYNPFMWITTGQTPWSKDQSKLNNYQNIAKEIIEKDASQSFVDNQLGYNKILSNGKTVQETLDEGALIKSNNLGGKTFRSIGNMIPSLMTGNELGSLASMGVSSFGSGVENAYNQGATRGEATGYGMLNSAIEVGTEKMSAGVGGAFGKGALDDIVKEGIEKKVKNQVVRKLVDLGIDSLGEGSEELIGDLLQPLAQKLTYASEEELSKLYKDQNYLEDFVSGALSSVIIQGTTMPFKNTNTTTNKTSNQSIINFPKTNSNLKEINTNNINISNNENISQNEIKQQNNQIAPLSLSNQIKNAINNKNSTNKSYLGNVSSFISKKIEQLTGINVTNRKHIITDNDIRHMIKNHGNPKVEESRNQIAITEKDIANIPEIINHPDNIKKGSPNKEGASIRYIKNINEEMSYVVEVVPQKGNVLKIKTMWKEPIAAANALDNNPTLRYTSETESNSSNSTLIGNNISQSNENVKLETSIPNNYSMQVSQKNAQELENSSFNLKEKPIAPVKQKIESDEMYETMNKDDDVLTITKKDLKKSNNKTSKNDKTSELLNKRPERSKKTLKDNYNSVVREIVDKGEAINRLSKKTGNKELYFKYDHMGTSKAEGMYNIATAQTDNNGNKIGKSIMEIWKPVEDAKLVDEFSYYLLHKHNISRYEQGKPVFGESVTSDISRKFVEDSEKEYPQFKEWSKDINIYNKNQMQNMVDAGLTSKESQEYLNDTYNNYVRIYRSIKGTTPITQFKGNLKVNVPIKKAKGGNQDILPLKDSMAQQTLEIKKAIRKNEFGLELLKELDNGQNVEFDGKQTVVKNDDGTYSFTVFKEGQPIKMEIDEDIYKSLEPKKNNDPVMLAPVRALSKIQRGLLTDKNPLFIATNFFKDIGDAPFNSKYSSKFVKNYVVAAKEIKNNGKLWNKYKALGGEQNSYFDYDKGVKMPSNSKIKRFVSKISDANKIVEQLPRFTEFISTLESGGTEAEAMYNAAEITTNFKRGGDVAKAINRNGANFLNASIQGFDKQIRNFTGQNGAKGYINLLSKATVYGVLPSILNHLLLKDDDDYEDLPDYIKDNYFLFKTSEGNFIRIPKGRVVSIFGMAARRTLEYLDGEKDAYKGMLQQMGNQVAPNNPLYDNIFAPFMAIKNNKSWNGSDIVSIRLQDEPTKNQYDEKTDALSKFIGKNINVSPKKVNYIIDQYSGAIGDFILPMITPQAHQNPLSAKFTVNSVITNKNISDFYDKRDEYSKKNKDDNAKEKDIVTSKYLNSVKSEMDGLYSEKRKIQNSNLSNKEKMKEIKKVQAQINGIAKFALEDYKDCYIDGDYAAIGNREFKKNKKGEWEKVRR